MPQGRNYTSFILDDLEKINNFIGQFSLEMSDYIDQHSNSKFVLFYKNLTHSDLATFGKATRLNSHHKNLLYYIKEQDMKDIEKSTNKPFQTAHQSCIGLKAELYTMLGLPNPREISPYLVNDYMDVFVVNSNMKYFQSFYTKKIFEKLNKQVSPKSKSWNFDDLNVTLSNGLFTEIPLHIAVHGLGMEEDTEFHKIRHHLFKGDTLVLLYEVNADKKNLFLMFEKNPLFFSVIKEKNSTYVKYQERIRRKLITKITSRDNAVDDEDLQEQITRQEQNVWRNMLANEMMAYTQEPRQIFCPLTYITADFDKLGSLFIASHIKGFSDPNTTNEEKYDINNGIIICANADTLFDKHLITISQNRELRFSYLLDDDVRLKSQLLLMQPIFQPILNEQRMKYLAYHESVFEQKEIERQRAI